ncbi:MAG: hypothetical protein RL448_623, partial [Actinomycetota bacterium]
MSPSFDPQFWMGGRHATELMEVTEDPSKLNDGNFWAITSDFKGKFTAARFNKVETNTSFNFTWKPVSGKWQSSFNQNKYCAYVKEIQNEIAAGNVYQVNACRVLTAQYDQSIIGLANKLISENPAKYGGYLGLPGIEIASASPERFLTRVNGNLITSPI